MRRHLARLVLIAGVALVAACSSGTGSQSTSGTLTATKRTTASGYPATAVDGFPSDTIRYALETLHLQPDVVISGPRGADVVNLNIPSCTAGKVREVKDVPRATAPADCTSTVTDVLTDVAAFHANFATATQLDAAGNTVTSSTTFPVMKIKR